MTIRSWWTGAVGVAVLAACASNPGQGAEGQACYPNDSCNAGLACLSHLCVKLPDAGGGGVGGGSAGGVGGGSAGGVGGGSAGGAAGGSGGGGGGLGGGGGSAGGAGGGTADAGSTIGAACASSTVCAGAGESCSTFAFDAGPLNPDSSGSCVSLNCTTSGGAFPFGCAGDRGTCTGVGGTTACLGRCTFGSGTAASGCVGSTTCRYVDFYARDAGTVTGYGYCLGGCSSTTACPGGSTCQLETATCVKTLSTYTKSVGVACTQPTGDCNCLTPRLGTASYCSTACVLGGTSCPTGFTCGAGLPTTDGTGAVFSADPTGVAGFCLKNCSTDADCVALNSHCDPQPGGVKTCLPGPR